MQVVLVQLVVVMQLVQFVLVLVQLDQVELVQLVQRYGKGIKKKPSQYLNFETVFYLIKLSSKVYYFKMSLKLPLSCNFFS